jgi:hypothetical protein
LGGMSKAVRPDREPEKRTSVFCRMVQESRFSLPDSQAIQVSESSSRNVRSVYLCQITAPGRSTVPMHSNSCFFIDEESRVIAGTEVHEERELVTHGLPLSRGWMPTVVIHSKKCFGVHVQRSGENDGGSDPARERSSLHGQ